MTVDVTIPAPDPAPGADRKPPAPGAWAVSWHGVRTVTVLELRQRVRSTRWIVSLAVFGLLVFGVTALTYALAQDGTDMDDPIVGSTMFGFIVFFVLFLGLLVSPTLSATAINGDRSAGTLATLQVTLLSAAEIVLGKLLAAWLASLAFLAVSLPFLLWALLAGGAQPWRMVVTVLVLAVLLAVVCAIGLGFSALTARTAGSAVLTYVSVASLCVLSLITFGLTLPLMTADEEVRVYEQGPYSPELADSEGCQWTTRVEQVVHTERTWWLLAVNPFVIVADAAPRSTEPDVYSFDPLTGIREGVRLARLGPPDERDYCWTDGDDTDAMASAYGEDTTDLAPVWPWGLALNLLLGAAAVVVAVRRLTIPQRTLAKGTRVA